jgi:RNA polymerase sigma-70 factor (ECF subfamily)
MNARTLPLSGWPHEPALRAPRAGASRARGDRLARGMQTQPSKASEAMSRYADGDDAAFDTLYAELAPPLTRYLRRMIKDQGAVADLLQQAFLQIHLARSRFVRGARVEPWAFTITRVVAMEWLRREYRRRARERPPEPTPQSALDDPLLGLSAAELNEALRHELQGLSPKLREAFLLVKIDGLTHAEAAQVLGIEESATKVRAHRAAGWLREKLSRFRPKEDPG